MFVRSYPDIGIESDRSASDSAFLHSGHQSDSMKDSKQEELTEEEGRWVESQILALTIAFLIYQ
jgi:hypothetical protein